MGPLLVESSEVTLHLLSLVSAIFEGLQVDALVHHAAPEPFHEDVVLATALAVHADPDIMGLQRLVKAWLVNWQPWSVLNISGGPWRASASLSDDRDRHEQQLLDV